MIEYRAVVTWCIRQEERNIVMRT